MTPIALVGSIPNILVVNPKLGVTDVKGLIALAKQKPDELLYGASGLGSGPHLATELFKQMAGIKMTGVLYPGSGQTAIDLISGRIQVMFAPAPTVLGLIKDGRVKALATTEAKRASVAPDLPTIAEAALPGYAAGLWFGILGPGRHAAAGDRQTIRGDQRGPEGPGSAQGAGAAGPECRRRQPGRLRPFHQERNRALGPRHQVHGRGEKSGSACQTLTARGHRRPPRLSVRGIMCMGNGAGVGP